MARKRPQYLRRITAISEPPPPRTGAFFRFRNSDLAVLRDLADILQTSQLEILTEGLRLFEVNNKARIRQLRTLKKLREKIEKRIQQPLDSVQPFPL